MGPWVYRVCQGYIRGPSLRAHTKNPCNYPQKLAQARMISNFGKDGNLHAALDIFEKLKDAQGQQRKPKPFKVNTRC